MHTPCGHKKNVLPTLQLIIDAVLDGSRVPVVELSTGSMLEGGAEVESGMPFRVVRGIGI